MKRYKITALLLCSLPVFLASCLKQGNMNSDPANSNSVLEFANTGDNLAAAASTYPGFYSDLGVLTSGNSTQFNVNVSYSGAGSAPDDITVNLAIDTATLSTYNTDNGTAYVTPPTTIFSIPTSVVIKKGTSMTQVKATISNNSSFDYSVNYALAVKIASASTGIISKTFGKAVYAFGVRNAYDGHYSFKGYSLRAGDAAKTGNFTYSGGLDLVTAGGNIVQFGILQVWADLTGVGIGYPILTVNSDNTVTSSSSGGAYNAPGYTSRYVPSTKTFYISYSWGAGPTARLATDTLTFIKAR